MNSDQHTTPETPLLSVRDLTVRFGPDGSTSLRARTTGAVVVDDVSFELYAGESLGIIGESGSGKTTVARAILRLLKPTSGDITFDGLPWLRLRGRQLRAARRDMQAVFQDPSTSLDPRMSVLANVMEPFLVNQADASRAEAAEAAQRMLREVGVNDSHWQKRPKALSGGQQQRVAIARALVCRPQLVVCDEPLSALDVSVQAQIVNLLMRLKRKLRTSYLIIGHDLSIVRYACDRVAVMYAGQLVEVASSEELFARPRHPYTRLLLSVVPRPPGEDTVEQLAFEPRGEIPSPRNLPPGCHFQPRCPFATALCATTAPTLTDDGLEHRVACHHADEIEAQSQATQGAPVG